MEPERQECLYNNGANANPSVGNPIVLKTGAKTIAHDDFSTSDGRFKVSRFYRSIPVGRSTSFVKYPLGLAPGWQFNFALELQLGTFSGSPSSPNAKVTIVAPDGTGHDFKLRSDGAWEQDTSTGNPSADYKVSFVGTLPTNLADVRLSSSTWRVVDRDNTEWVIETFPLPNQSSPQYAFGRPTERIERDGYTWTYAYGTDNRLETITDDFGKQLTFTWNYFYVTFLTGISGSLPYPEAVAEIGFPDGTKVKYLYDPTPATVAPSTSVIERLVGVEWYDGSNTLVDSLTYHYDDSRFAHHVTGITDHASVMIAEYAYDGFGRAVNTKGADGTNEFTVAYAETATEYTRTVTNPLGKEAVYTFTRFGSTPNDVRLTTIDGLASTNCPASSSSYDYDGNKLISKTIDEEGRETRFVRQADGLPTSITEGYGTPEARTRTITWNSALRVPTQIVEPGLTTDATYDMVGRLTGVTRTDTTSHTLPYPTNGQQRTWTFDYTAEGLLESVDGPLSGAGDTIAYAYTASGFLETVTNEVGLVTEITDHDGAGRPLTVVDPNGIETELTYDARGRVLTRTVDPGPDEAVTSFTYTASGQIERITRPDGSWFDFIYDASERLEAVENNAGERIAYTRDALGNVTDLSIEDDSSTLVYALGQTFDELGRLLTQVGVGSRTFGFGYDKTDNLVQITDPRTNTSSYAFDALNRLVQETDEEGGEVDLALNAQDAVTTYSDPRDLDTTYVRNGFGDAIQQVSPDTGTSVYEVNALGLVTKITDARGVVTDMTYDNAGRRLTRSFPGSGGENVAYTWDSVSGGNKGKGRLTGMTDATGTTAFVYDARGNVASETRTIASRVYTVSYTHDAADRVTSLTYPSGRIVDYGYDAQGRVQWIETQEDALSPSETVAEDAYHMPWGPLQSLWFGNGLAVWNTFDTDYRIGLLGLEDVSTSTAIIQRFHTYTDDLNLTNIWDGVDPAQDRSFWYSAARRLQNASGPWGDLTYYYGLGNNRTWEILDDGVTTLDRQFGYPFDSNRLLEVYDDSVLTRSMSYDDAGNITGETKGATAWTFGHNHAGRLASVTEGGLAKGAYTYDGLERLGIRTVSNTVPSGTTHLVYDTSGHLIAEADATGQTVREYIWLDDLPVAVVADVATTPELLFVHADHLGRPIRMTDGTQATVWTATYRPFGEVESVTGPASFDLRFPGQWFQLESGLAYNWHRHYDPTTGRYLEPDPLGLADGPSLYAYAGSSPLMFTDPTGEAAWIPILIGTGVGLGLEAAADYVESQCGCDDNSSVASYVGAGAAGAIIGDMAMMTPYNRSGLGGAGSSNRTSVTSRTLSKIPGRSPISLPAPTMKNPGARSASIGRVLGRWAPAASAGYTVYDVYRIAKCLIK